MWRLLYPLHYFALRNKKKWEIDVFPTAILTFLISLPFVLFPDVKFFDSGGFIDKILPLTAALTAFYVAALVAVATFSHPDLDKPITIGSIFEVVKNAKGEKDELPLTRREFACVIFGYLAFSSLAISIIGAVVVPLADSNVIGYPLWPVLRWILSEPQASWLRALAVVGISAVVSHLVVVTCLGLYYLMDRIHRREPKVTTPKPPIS